MEEVEWFESASELVITSLVITNQLITTLVLMDISAFDQLLSELSPSTTTLCLSHLFFSGKRRHRRQERQRGWNRARWERRLEVDARRLRHRFRRERRSRQRRWRGARPMLATSTRSRRCTWTQWNLKVESMESRSCGKWLNLSAACGCRGFSAAVEHPAHDFEVKGLNLTRHTVFSTSSFPFLLF